MELLYTSLSIVGLTYILIHLLTVVSDLVN